MSNRTDFVAGFILGGLLGTALALLFAPRSGEETRQRLTEEAEDLRDRARERADEVVRKVRGTAEELTQRGRSRLDESAARLRDVVERGRETLEEKTRELRRQVEERPEGYPALTQRLPARLRPGLAILSRLREAGWETYLVGGVVRDLLLGRLPADLDIVTAAPPGAVEALFDRTAPVGAEFGVVAVIVEGHPYQVATFRTEGPYLDGRRPATVGPADAAADVQRRDFTINALLYDPITDTVIDHVGGLADLARRVIRTVGDPAARFAEDRLRLLRAVRLAAELGFAIEEGALRALTSLASTVTAVSAERIRDELIRLLTAHGRAQGVRLLQQTGLLAALLPDVAGSDGLAHACLTLQHLHRPAPALAVAALLLSVDSPDRAAAICRRLRFSKADMQAVVGLLAGYGRVPEIRTMRSGDIRGLLRRLEPADLLDLYRAEAAARGDDLSAYRRAAQILATRTGARPAPRLLSGDDLIALGHPPGPRFPAILDAVEQARERGEITTPEEARVWVLARFGAGAPSRPAEETRRPVHDPE